MQITLMKLRKGYRNGGFMQDNAVDVNAYVKKLIESKAFRKKAFQDFTSNNFSIDKIYGVLTADGLHLLLQKAKRNRIFQLLLTDLLNYVDSMSMTDTNFRLLLKSNRKYRSTYLSCIGHANLSFYQMQILNQYPLALEAFSWLFDNICHYNIFTEEDMTHILQQNPDITPIAIQNCIDAAYKNYGNSLKIDVAKHWIKNTFDI